MDKAAREDWQTLIEGDGLLIAEDGSLRFTAKHRDKAARYFAMAGIDIASIRTMDDYLAARRVASPYFEQWIVSEIERKEPSLERQLLIATFIGDKREARKLKMQIDTRRAESKKPIYAVMRVYRPKGTVNFPAIELDKE